MHTIMYTTATTATTALIPDAGRLPRTLFPTHIRPADHFLDSSWVRVTMPVDQSPMLIQDDEDEDLMVVALPDTPSPIRKRSRKAIHPESLSLPTEAATATATATASVTSTAPVPATAAAPALGKRFWNATKGAFQIKNKKTLVYNNDDDEDSFVFVSDQKRTPHRPTSELSTCQPPVPIEHRRETKKESVSRLEIVTIASNDNQEEEDDEEEQTMKRYAAWIQHEKNIAARGGHALCTTPPRTTALTSPPSLQRIIRRVEFEDPYVVKGMGKIGRVVAKKLQSI